MDKRQSAFDNYFGTVSDSTPNMLTSQETPTYSSQKVTNPRENVGDNYFTTGGYQLMADENIDTIQQLCDILKQILNAAWGSNWGEISPDLKKGEDSAKIKIPQITVDVNNREVAERMPLKPVLMQTIKEVNNGKPTGDSFLVYRQWFDCVVEFDFYGSTSKEVRDLQYKFETLLAIYTGYLKRKGVSEILFLKEVSARNSLNFTEQTPMKCLMYFVRLERITPVRQSLINKINANVGIKELDNDKVQIIIEANQNLSSSLNDTSTPAEIEFDFFKQDTGVDYDI